MKRTILVLLTILVVFVAVLAVLAVRPVRTVKAHHGCSNATLKGSYGLVAPGFWYSYYATNVTMLAEFDGNGNLSASNAYGSDRGHAYGPYTLAGGTYTVNSDCTCTLSIPFPDYLGATAYGNGIVVDTGGDELVGMLYSYKNSTAFWNATFDAKRVGEGKRGFPD